MDCKAPIFWGYSWQTLWAVSAGAVHRIRETCWSSGKWLAGAALLVGIASTLSQAAAQAIPEEIFQAILDAGAWSPTADENLNLREQLSLATVQAIVQSYPSTTHELGLLVLTTSAGKWGVLAQSGSSIPDDPAHDEWRGPNKVEGKHLMSYRTGGVGLPHLDVGSLANFVRYLLSQSPALGPAAEQERMGAIARQLDRSLTFAQVRNDPVFRKWMLAGLRQRESQRWILEHWLTDYWDPAIEATGSDVRAALVLARIWNSSGRLAKCALELSANAKDRVDAMLEAYASPTLCAGADPKLRTRRFPWMRRPIVLYDAYKR